MLGRIQALADDCLTAGLQGLVPDGIVAAADRIRPGDGAALTPAECRQFDHCVRKVRSASGAARRLARQILADRGEASIDILKTARGVPIWPSGIRGSLSHDDTVAAAIVTRDARLRGLGVDVEPDLPLPPELVPIIASLTEHGEAARHGVTPRQIFSIKEAVFKSVFPDDGIMLDFTDVKLSLDSATARTGYGREVHFRTTRHPRIFSVAWF